MWEKLKLFNTSVYENVNVLKMPEPQLTNLRLGVGRCMSNLLAGAIHIGKGGMTLCGNNIVSSKCTLIGTEVTCVFCAVVMEGLAECNNAPK